MARCQWNLLPSTIQSLMNLILIALFILLFFLLFNSSLVKKPYQPNYYWCIILWNENMWKKVLQIILARLYSLQFDLLLSIFFPNNWSRAMICGNYKSEAEIVIPATMLFPKRPLQRIETHEDCRQPEAAQQMYWTTCKRNNFFYRIHVRSLVYPC